METPQTAAIKKKRALLRRLCGVMGAVVVFLFGPLAIRPIYAFTTGSAEITALEERYLALASEESRLPASQQLVSARRRDEIADWLGMREDVIDGGNDEALDNAAFPVAVCGFALRNWAAIFRYWFASHGVHGD